MTSISTRRSRNPAPSTVPSDGSRAEVESRSRHRASEALSVLAVDDERDALDEIARLLVDDDRIGEVDTAGSGRQALQRIALKTYDAVFLAVRMPDLSGVEVARLMRRFASPPAIVFVSAYATAAVEAFELRAIDYLLKPVDRARIDDALSRIAALPRAPIAGAWRAPAAGASGDGLVGDVVAVDNVRGGTRLLTLSSILCLQSSGDYVRVIADCGRFLIHSPLGDLERRWQAHGFVRVHRCYVVNVRQAVELRPLTNGTAVLTLSDRSEVPVARRQLAQLRRRLRA